MFSSKLIIRLFPASKQGQVVRECPRTALGVSHPLMFMTNVTGAAVGCVRLIVPSTASSAPSAVLCLGSFEGLCGLRRGQNRGNVELRSQFPPRLFKDSHRWSREELRDEKKEARRREKGTGRFFAAPPVTCVFRQT